MVLDYVNIGLVREDAVCPYCGSDLIICFAGEFIIIQCVDCEFTHC